MGLPRYFRCPLFELLLFSFEGGGEREIRAGMGEYRMTSVYSSPGSTEAPIRQTNRFSSESAATASCGTYF